MMQNGGRSLTCALQTSIALRLFRYKPMSGRIVMRIPSRNRDKGSECRLKDKMHIDDVDTQNHGQSPAYYSDLYSVDQPVDKRRRNPDRMEHRRHEHKNSHGRRHPRHLFFQKPVEIIKPMLIVLIDDVFPALIAEYGGHV